MGVATSLLVHVVFIVFLISATKRPILPEPVRTTEVQLVRAWPSPPRLRTSSPGSPKPAEIIQRADGRPVLSVDAPAPPVREPVPPVATAPRAEPGSALDEGERRGLASALRGSVGCAQTDFNALTPAEQQHCRDRFATAPEGVHDDAELGIDPIKRAAFDASWKADHGPQHMAGVACVAVFGKGGLKWLHPSEGVKLGPLPCYAYTPKATFAADPEHARGW